MEINLHLFKTELQTELQNIIGYWANRMPDEKNGGFIGRIDAQDQKKDGAEKGAVLNARILWTFSAIFRMEPSDMLKKNAKKAFNYINTYFYNVQNQGIYWSLEADGKPKDTKNQIYALAFVIYAVAEYYIISNDERALEMAVNLYHSIQKHSYDTLHKGYVEAFTSDWQPITDLRLSDKDANEKKTMNTHLHIAEAYANLYKVWKNDNLLSDLTGLLETIEAHFIDTKTGHLKLFFDEKWNETQDVISYGHDIEAAWLLLQCAEMTNDQDLVRRYAEYALLLANATIEGIDKDGGLWYEMDINTGLMIREKHWWPQAELIIGFINAWQLTNQTRYLDIALDNWAFIKKYIIDHKNGEWYWGINENGKRIEKDKAGFWKCPYHNSRACIEAITRINKYQHAQIIS